MRALLLFDIDGVIRDVSQSYRLAIQKTVYYFNKSTPTLREIDELKNEGEWNNDWDASLELIKRGLINRNKSLEVPSREKVINIFTEFYFGGDPNQKNSHWKGFIKKEQLLVDKEFFQSLTNKKICWGFVSGAERPSAKFVLETRIGLKDPPLISMGDAPEKPDPTGLLMLTKQLIDIHNCKTYNLPVFYLGDTVADVLTVINARKKSPKQNFISVGISPPHLLSSGSRSDLTRYEESLMKAGANFIIRSTCEIKETVENYLINPSNNDSI